MKQSNASVLGAVPETVLKKRRKDESWKASRGSGSEASKKRREEKGKQSFRRAEDYVREYVKQERDLKRLKREVKEKKNGKEEHEEKVVFALRIRGFDGLHPRTEKMLKLLRLGQAHTGVFLKGNKTVMHMLRMVSPYVAYGCPNLKTIKELVYKRGYARVEKKKKVALTDNDVIEKALGPHDIICIEDLVHELHTAGPHFKEVNNFLWPFKLSPPADALNKKRNEYFEAKEAGNRGAEINDLILRMN